jgi:hypothetical protein
MAIHSRMPVILPFWISSSIRFRVVLRSSRIWFWEKYLIAFVGDSINSPGEGG